MTVPWNAASVPSLYTQDPQFEQKWIVSVMPLSWGKEKSFTRLDPAVILKAVVGTMRLVVYALPEILWQGLQWHVACFCESERRKRSELVD